MVSDVKQEAYGNTATIKRPTGPASMERITLEVADNGGVTVTCSYKMPERGSTGPGEMLMPPRDKKHVFEDASSAMDFVATKLGVEPADPGDESEPDAADTAEGGEGETD